MPTFSSIPPGVNLFASPSSNHPIPSSHNPISPSPPIPIPKYPPPRRKNPPPPLPSRKNPALKAPHRRSHYYKPLPRHPAVLASEDGGDRSVVVGESGVSYLLPGAPFEFQFSYSETPKAKPVAIREPAHLPFAPPTMPRPWTGKPPLKKKKEKKIRLIEPLNPVEEEEEESGIGKRFEMGSGFSMEGVRTERRSREEIQGRPLLRKEVKELLRPRVSSNRQVNLGRDGLTHNMLELIHTHWRRQEVCKVRCLGVPTVDMDNVCYHLEEKTQGKIILRVGGVVYIYRGRNYNPRTRPKYPIMLWKPAAPVYPKLIQDSPEGLTKQEADELRLKGKKLLPICKLAKNGVYTSLVKDVRDAFEESPLVKINCEGLDPSDYKKVGAKLKELVPCVLLSFDDEQVLMWRGNDWKSMYETGRLTWDSATFGVDRSDDGSSSLPHDSLISKDVQPTSDTKVSAKPTGRTLLLWEHALNSNKALLLEDLDLDLDFLLEKVEAFSMSSQAMEHSYPAHVTSIGDLSEDESDNDSNDFEDVESFVDFSSLPVDSIVEASMRD